MTALSAALVLLSQREYEFTFVSKVPVQSVSVAGTFNGWDRARHPMQSQDTGHTWRVSVPMPYGKHLYKFVINGQDWTVDPAGSKTERDGGGNLNSVLFHLPEDFRTPASPGDRALATSVLSHVPTSSMATVDQGRAILRIKARPDDVAPVFAVVDGKRHRMHEVSRDWITATFETAIPIRGQQPIRYHFALGEFGPLGAGGLGSSQPFTLNPANAFAVPDWPQRSVMYQIFPDRFANGSVENDPKGVVPWAGQPTFSNHFGGDFAGVAQRAQHLKTLGVTTVYFNPIFESPSNHRYDTSDYFKVDSELGTNEEFARLAIHLKQQGIRTVLDLVLNHTATDFAPFQNLVKNQAKSEFKDWYFVKRFPISLQGPPNYEGWAGFGHMPKLNVRNRATEAYLFGVLNHWTSVKGVDGIRLDVAGEVDSEFWRRMRTMMRQSGSDTWIVGEIWDDANPWLQGDQFDSVMNYPFRSAMVSFLASQTQTASEFASELNKRYRAYAPQVSRNLMNLLSSHDVPRFMTEVGGNENLAKLGATLQFAWAGIPSIYYGEEIGMTGGPDPENRKGMAWESAAARSHLIRHYQTLSWAKRTVKSLQTGDAWVGATSDAQQTGLMIRWTDKESTVVGFNRSRQPQTVFIPPAILAEKVRAGNYFDVLSGKRYSISNRPLSFQVPAQSAVMLVSERYQSLFAQRGAAEAFRIPRSTRNVSLGATKKT